MECKVGTLTGIGHRLCALLFTGKQRAIFREKTDVRNFAHANAATKFHDDVPLIKSVADT